MNPESTAPTTPASSRMRPTDVVLLLARWVLAGLFIYMGLSKALDPVGFLKLVHEYDILHPPFLLNLVAATLPWFEIFCGLLLLLGVAIRGSALVIVGMLVPFTIVVLLRALDLAAAGQIPFCTVRFDCGCGGGAVLICRKLAENAVLTACAIILVFRPRHRLALRPVLRH